MDKEERKIGGNEYDYRRVRMFETFENTEEKILKMYIKQLKTQE